MMVARKKVARKKPMTEKESVAYTKAFRASDGKSMRGKTGAANDARKASRKKKATAKRKK